MDVLTEHDRVVLTTDLPSEKLAAGDVGTVVHVYRDGAALEVEFVSLDGETMAVVTLERAQLRPVSRREITHARLVAGRNPVWPREVLEFQGIKSAPRFEQARRRLRPPRPDPLA